MEISFDLFGSTLLLRNWGRIGTGGRLRSDPYPDVAAASVALGSLADKKRRRGYLDVTRLAPRTIGRTPCALYEQCCHRHAQGVGTMLLH
jgi:predicted DNA-binding WGR domain protein